MNNVTKQILVGVGVAVFSAAVFGAKGMYDDIQTNNAHRQESIKTVEGLHEKLDLIIVGQQQVREKIAVLENNQQHLMEGRFNVGKEN